jgi:hypothetical protein
VLLCERAELGSGSTSLDAWGEFGDQPGHEIAPSTPSPPTFYGGSEPCPHRTRQRQAPEAWPRSLYAEAGLRPPAARRPSSSAGNG